MFKRIFFVLILSLLATTVAFADRTVRDRNGNITEVWRDRGSYTEIRDRNGNLIRSRNPTRDGGVDVRDRNGGLIEREDGESE